jgi:hypothetical protein
MSVTKPPITPSSSNVIPTVAPSWPATAGPPSQSTTAPTAIDVRLRKSKLGL